MHAYDAGTWHLPLFGGRVHCSGLGFHFWDATDDFSNADMDLLFEGHQLYLHNARGMFGAVPMTITGASCCCPDLVVASRQEHCSIVAHLSAILLNSRSHVLLLELYCNAHDVLLCY